MLLLVASKKSQQHKFTLTNMTHEEMLEEAQKREEDNKKESNRKKPFVIQKLIPDDYRTSDD